ncbi:MAG: hypothetical protein KC777_18635 [Cyanobacteria bacterium HKST-UBA02]|nr:hypothetical protein [Cyanobacteria bacterium HKST-UBA02]
MNSQTSPDYNYALQRMLCAKAAAALRNLTAAGQAPDPRLMAAVEAKLAYLDGCLSKEGLESFRASAQDAKSQALQTLLDDPSNRALALATFYAAEAAVCAASIEQEPDIDDPVLEAMMEQYLQTGL